MAEVESDPEIARSLDFDMESVGKPDIFVEDNQVFRLGRMETRAIDCPGHSSGGYVTALGIVHFPAMFYVTEWLVELIPRMVPGKIR
ncbi:MAG: MBL fold metallo-hydrolase [Candidatus Eisenbacteria bacterium]|nr:MBL fold metallo-hydrolase [Candidatus Eisenbacteria bacterium]